MYSQKNVCYGTCYKICISGLVTRGHEHSRIGAKELGLDPYRVKNIKIALVVGYTFLPFFKDIKITLIVGHTFPSVFKNIKIA